MGKVVQETEGREEKGTTINMGGKEWGGGEGRKGKRNENSRNDKKGKLLA